MFLQSEHDVSSTGSSDISEMNTSDLDLVADVCRAFPFPFRVNTGP